MTDQHIAAVDSNDARLYALLHRTPRLSQRHPAVYPLAVWAHRARRRARWARSRTDWATARSDDDLPFRVHEHGSLLLRQLGESQMWLQHGKVTNLQLASRRLDGLLLRPGQTFSFNRVVGSCTSRAGYVEGMRLSNGEASPGVGGGICQLANLVHWMVLHSPLTVTERSEHSFDPFPDNDRVIPWGTGCTIVYNYVDLCVRNDTDLTFQLRVRVGDQHLQGQLRADATPAHTYSVHARDEEFLSVGNSYLRRNELWRCVIDRRTGETVRDECVRRNAAVVKYVPTGVPIRPLDLPDPRLGRSGSVR